MNRRIEAARRKCSVAEAGLTRVVAEVQATCPHPEIVVAPYHSHRVLGGGLLPYFVCTDCGQHENGWYATSFGRNGYLPESACRRVTREEVYALREGANRNTHEE